MDRLSNGVAHRLFTFFFSYHGSKFFFFLFLAHRRCALHESQAHRMTFANHKFLMAHQTSALMFVGLYAFSFHFRCHKTLNATTEYFSWNIKINTTTTTTATTLNAYIYITNSPLYLFLFLSFGKSCCANSRGCYGPCILAMMEMLVDCLACSLSARMWKIYFIETGSKRIKEKIVGEEHILRSNDIALHETPSMLNIITLELHTQKAATRNHNYKCAVVIVFAIQRSCVFFLTPHFYTNLSRGLHTNDNGSDYDDDEKTRISFPCLFFIS